MTALFPAPSQMVKNIVPLQTHAHIPEHNVRQGSSHTMIAALSAGDAIIISMY